MATLKPVYGTPTAFTITLTSLAASAAQQSAVVDNTTTLALDYLIGGGFKTAAGSLGSNPVVNIWVFALTDGTNYGGTGSGNTLGGGNAAFTMPSNTGNLRLAASVVINTAASIEYCNPVSVAALFNGEMPQKFGIVVQNLTGLALDATTPGNVDYQAINLQSV